MVNAVVGKWRSKYRSGSRAQQALVEACEQQQHSSTCVNRAKVANGREIAATEVRDEVNCE